MGRNSSSYEVFDARYTPDVIRDEVVRSGAYKSISDKLTDDTFTTDHVVETIDSIKEALYTGAVHTDNGYKQFNDILSTPALTRFTEAAVVEVMRSSIEPNLVIVPNLFTTMNVTGPVPSIRITTVGPVRISEVAEGGDYKDSDLEMDEELQRIDIAIRKYGGMIRITEEVIEQNFVDLIRMWIQKMGTSFAQHKEKTALQMINRMGKIVMDGANPSSSVLGSPTGRGIDGNANGTMSLHDFFDMYAFLVMRGFTPDTMIMNPMAWKMFMTDPETREIIVKNGVLATRQMPNGSYAPGWGSSFNGLGERHVGTGLSTIDPSGTQKAGVSAFGTSLATNHNLSMLGGTFNIPPSANFLSPLKIIVTPYAGFRSVSSPSGAYATDVYLADSSACGVLVQRELPMIEEFSDPWRDIQVTKAREKYGFGILEQGKGIAVARNIVVDRNYVFENTNTATLSELTSSVATATV